MVTIISANLGLGDSITLSGAMVELARQYGQVRVPAMPEYMENVRSFYINHPEIEVYPVTGEPPIEWFNVIGKPMACGRYGPRVEAIVTMPEYIYRQLGVDYRHRWDSCPIQKASERVEQVENHGSSNVFLHDDIDRGFVITKGIARKNCFVPDNDKTSILRYANLIGKAKEIHVIDSCFYHLSESLETCGKLYLHRYARGAYDEKNNGGVRMIQMDYPSRKAWTMVT